MKKLISLTVLGLTLNSFLVEARDDHSSFLMGLLIGNLMKSGNASDNFRLGIGSQYLIQNLSNGANIRNIGAYLNMEERLIIFNQVYGFDVKIGSSKANFSGSPIIEIQPNSTMGVIDGWDGFLEVRSKTGFNLATKENPLIFTIGVGLYGYISNFFGPYRNTHGFSIMQTIVGLNIEGKIKTGKKTYLEYSMGYDWIPYSTYYFMRKDNEPASAYLNVEDYSYGIHGSFGFLSNFTEYTGYYMRFNVEYKELSKTMPIGNIAYYPRSNTYSFGLELGFVF